MRVSVITPTFNARHFIEACVDNVAGQGEVVLEHIIADGGSTDGTVELIKQMQSRHSNLRLLPGPDRGQSDAMNKATALAQGEIIGILNADDFYEPGAVRRGAEVLSRTTVPALVCGDCKIIGADGKMLLMNRPKYLFLEGLLQDSWLFPIPANPSAYFYTRSVHDIVGGYDIEDNLAMDCQFLFACAKRVKMIYVPEHWGNFRYIPGSKTFEDVSGPTRVTRIIDRYKSGLSASQRRRMQRWRLWVNWKFKAGNRLRRLGLLPA